MDKLAFSRGHGHSLGGLTFALEHSAARQARINADGYHLDAFAICLTRQSCCIRRFWGRGIFQTIDEYRLAG